MTPWKKKRNRNCNPPELCTFPGCGRKYRCSGYCARHYELFRKTGSAENRSTAHGVQIQWIKDHVKCEDSACLTWPFNADSAGYACAVAVNKVSKSACHWMLELSGRPRLADNHCALHSCGNGHQGCVNPRHLRWGTQFENAMDRILHGRSCRGESHTAARLTNEQASEIKRLLIAGDITQAEIAQRFGVSPQTVSGIKGNRVWGWLEVAP